MEEQQEMERGKLRVLPSKEQIALTAGTLLTAGVADIAMHAGGTGAFVGLLATFVVARHSKDIVDYGHDLLSSFVPGSDAARVVEVTDRVVEKTLPSGNYDDQATLSKLKRLVGVKPPTAQTFVGRDIESPAAQTWQWQGEDVTMPQLDSSMFTFSQLLATGFVPTINKIFLGRLLDGTNVFVKAEDLCHVALAGNTGGGKSSLMRMIMAQLCYIRAHVLLLNPHYMRYDRKHDEDWTPYEPYLMQSPVECAKYEHIRLYLRWLTETLLPQRRVHARNGGLPGKPVFVFLDELPDIVKKIPEASGYISELLRQGRKYGIFLVSASQSFLVKVIDAEGEGDVREMYRTAFYVGGDPKTATTLLKMPAKDIQETQLGKGTVMLRCAMTQEAVMAKVPYVDNPSLYRFLGPSTFVPPADDGREEHFSFTAQMEPVPQVTRRLDVDTEPLATVTKQLPKELQQAYDAYRVGMTYRDLGRELGCTSGEARVLYLELRRRGLLHAQVTQQAAPIDIRQRTISALPLELQQAYLAYEQGYNTSRTLGPEIGVGKTKAAELIQDLKDRKLIS